MSNTNVLQLEQPLKEGIAGVVCRAAHNKAKARSEKLGTPLVCTKSLWLRLIQTALREPLS